MFGYVSKEFKIEKDTYKVRVELMDNGGWRINDVMVRKPRQREFRCNRFHIQEDLRYVRDFQEKLARTEQELIKMIGEERYNAVLLEAWNSLKPEVHS